MTASPFSIGSTVWPGLAKIVEEGSESMEIIAKLMGTGGEEIYYDGRNLRQELQDELGDLLAAIAFTIESNPQLSYETIAHRRERKLAQFREWHATQLSRDGK